MASKSVNIKDFWGATTNGTFEGSFNPDHTKFNFNELSYSDARGKVRKWMVSVYLLSDKDERVKMLKSHFNIGGLPEGYKGVYEVSSGIEGGKIRDVTPTIITEGKNIGRANETNPLTQTFREALGLFNKQNKKTASTDGYYPPMLVKKHGDTKKSTLNEADFENGVTLQPKLNGVHFVTFLKHTGEVAAYSRNMSEFAGQSLIKEQMRIIYKNLPKNKDYSKCGMPYFTGELYVHGKDLCWISGQARRKEDDVDLQYHIFDMFFPECNEIQSADRQLYLKSIFSNELISTKCTSIFLVDSIKVNSLEQINSLCVKYIKDGYEGVVVRRDTSLYEYSYNSKHSDNVLKFKPTFDDEYIISNYTEGTKGKDKGAIIWICRNGENTINFTVVPNLEYSVRYKLFKIMSMVEDGTNIFDKYIKDKPITIEYKELSKYGVPLQAKAKAIRTYESDCDDPIKILFEKYDLI